jgi:hypothetical protein
MPPEQAQIGFDGVGAAYECVFEFGHDLLLYLIIPFVRGGWQLYRFIKIIKGLFSSIN